MSGLLSTDVTQHILIVDDEINFLWPVARTLRARGYDVATAESGESALAHLARHHIDLVITDIKMPGIGGFELVDWLREHRPSALVVMMTAFGSVSVRERSVQGGALSYLEKPLDLSSLAGFVDRLFHSPNFAGRISDIDLLDYLQLIHNTHKSKTVQVSNRRMVGQLVFEKGQIIHAECGTTQGLAAYHTMLSWPGGTFTDLPFQAPPVRSVFENTGFLLIEAARMRDESHLKPLQTTKTTGGSGNTQEWASRPVSPWHTESGRQRAGLFGHYRQFLDALAENPEVLGAVLMSQERLVLARHGEFPAGAESLMFTYPDSCDNIGQVLSLGSQTCASLKQGNGEHLHFFHLENCRLAMRSGSGLGAAQADDLVSGHSHLLQSA